MISPFEQVSDELAAGIRGLERASQVALFAAAGTALRANYLAWEEASHLPSHAELLDRTINQSIAYALGECGTIDPSLLREVESATPAESNDVSGYPAAQGCWIVVDAALRCGLGEFDAADGAWYLIEPMIQATSERLLGVADPGSALQRESETCALDDPALRAALAALSESVETLRPLPIERRVFEGVISLLAAIAP